MKKIMMMLAAAVSVTAVAADQYYKLPKVKLIHDGWGFQWQGRAPERNPTANCI